mmetsp:Transcript_14413/g.43666  ORF Transcript_14413/g.43666 Transcript_14413/m.43666 type:complete len:91 (-) Transcript_14413:196-468(-)|eukprot:CAMPEP_0198648740 /NCGR_PEP_ID=MMETSP1467-20131203/3729_1 /TAXON_ID=1462469 /ORGANISM="unid. sp., Strain CCMP2135" /LENGTH=90 /DNA_ID=CAMNT_0044384479 /DNA_START=50 /DNA_END=322 /DNA_ORIENTATION=-
MATKYLEALKPLMSVSLYQNMWNQFAETAATQYFQKGKMAEPIVAFMLLVGTSGYAIEYFVLGRYHVAHKKEKTALALAEYDAKHGGHHH